jgi:hypothetical protein
MALHNKLFLINLNLTGSNCPSWESISEEDWQNILSNYIFKIADGFAFMGVSKKADLFPDGLSYFNDWALDTTGLVEVEEDIVCRFQLNDDCKAKLLEYEFALHGFETEKGINYHEFDQVYFFSGERLVGNYINHEGMIELINLNDDERALIERLEPHIKGAFIDSSVFKGAFKGL